MLKTRLIPCLLLKNGRNVKGINFTNHRDTGHPITNAKIYDAQGADELLLLDITANSENRDILYDIIRQTAEECFMPFGVGGGIKTIEDIQKILLSGADKICINTAAVENPEFITKAAQKFGRQCIVVSIDYKINKNGKKEVFTHSGAKPTGLDPVEWAKKAALLGAGEIMLTSIDHEGKREGFDFKTIKEVSDGVDIPVIASGGAGSLEDLRKSISEYGASAVSWGSLLHFTDQSVIKTRDFMKIHGVDVRIFV